VVSGITGKLTPSVPDSSRSGGILARTVRFRPTGRIQLLRKRKKIQVMSAKLTMILEENLKDSIFNLFSVIPLPKSKQTRPISSTPSLTREKESVAGRYLLALDFYVEFYFITCLSYKIKDH
jgi:hypothetical protein